MSTEITFRLQEMQRFLCALVTSRVGLRFLVSHLVTSFVLAFLVLLAIALILFSLFEGLLLQRRTLAVFLGTLVTLLVFVPLATMPFFSFKDVLHRLVHIFNHRGLFTHLSDHVFYRQTAKGEISLHLAKAHQLLKEKYQLVTKKTKEALPAPGGAVARNPVSRQLAIGLGRSIREAVRFSRQQVSKGSLRVDQPIVGATYGYLFGAAKSKMKLRRYQPGWCSRLMNGIFYRFGALHAVFMYFVIHDRLPPSFDPVYFIATVGDVIGMDEATS